MRFVGMRYKFNCMILSGKRKSIAREQKKLEEMVMKLFEKGDRNMGNDVRILRQSSKLDKLIVDEMMLRDMEKKISGENIKK
jgi:hypothetical protein